MSQTFIKNKEDFNCKQCGWQVVGNGYTNHCPHCLYSRHVDINPGDRANVCGGLMEPIDGASVGRGWKITHRCLKCGAVRENKAAVDDDLAVLAEAIKKGHSG